MSLRLKRIFVSFLFSLLLVFAVAGGAQAYTDVLSFGDSLSDNGYADGMGAVRMSNGSVWTEYLASNLGASNTNWAFSGATSGVDAPALVGSLPNADTQYGLQWQVGAYTTAYTAIADDTLITISAGGNDMFNGRSASTAAANIAGTMTHLISKGADAFMVMNLSPSQQNAGYTAWMAEFNGYLDLYFENLSGYYTEVDFYLLDMREFVPEVDDLEGTWLTGHEDNPDTVYAWYDRVGVHPTTEVHKQIAEYAMDSLPVPEPATGLLVIMGLLGIAGVQRKRVR